MSVEEYINNGELSQAKKGHSSAKIVVMAAANDFMASEEARNELKFCNKLLTFMFTATRTLKYVLHEESDIVSQLSPFLELGGSWKRAAQKLLCYECVIQGDGYNKLYVWNNLTLFQMAIMPGISDVLNKVETVSVLVTTKEIVHNWMLDEKNYAADKLVFSNASSLYLEIQDFPADSYDTDNTDYGYDYDTDSTDYYYNFNGNRPPKTVGLKLPARGMAWQNTMKFVKQVHMLAPNVREVAISFTVSNSSSSPEYNNDIVQCFAHLFGKVAVCSLKLDYKFPWIFNAPEITFLTKLSIRWFSGSVVTEKIITNSCNTLQELIVHMDNSSLQNFWRIVANYDRYVYPNLCKLTLTKSKQDELVEDLACINPAHVPFPSLVHVTLDSCYPFGDNTLFRGNFSKLEYLDANVDLGLVMALAELEHYELPASLCHAKFYYDEQKGIIQSRISDALVNKIRDDTIFGILPKNLHTLVLFGTDIPMHVVPKVMRKGFTNLYSLSLREIDLGITNVCELVCSLPMLKSIDVAYVYSEGLCTDKSVQEVAGMLALKYPQVTQSRLYEVFAFGAMDAYYQDQAICNLILLLVCPSFKRVKIGNGSQYLYDKAMEMVRDKIGPAAM
ncbi:hypothetical protein GGF39_001464 [Coemansia sp. RSA 1721]|nr:hypothetical protein GGF39_001464 [Coemansia sp. RSA 1721]